MTDIFITSASRPALLEVTIGSFLEKIDEKTNLMFYISEDYVDQHRSMDCLKVIGDLLAKYKVALLCNNPPGGLSRAFKWFGSISTSEFIFYLQDDWEAIREIPMLKAIEMMQAYQNVNQIRFNKRKTMAYKGEKGEYIFTKEELKLPHGGYLVTSDAWYFNPGLWRAKFIKPFLKKDYPSKPSQRPFVWKLNQAIGNTYKVRKKDKLFIGSEYALLIGTYIYGRIGEPAYFKHLGSNNRMQIKSKVW